MRLQSNIRKGTAYNNAANVGFNTEPLARALAGESDDAFYLHKGNKCRLWKTFLQSIYKCPPLTEWLRDLHRWSFSSTNYGNPFMRLKRPRDWAPTSKLSGSGNESQFIMADGEDKTVLQGEVYNWAKTLLLMNPSCLSNIHMPFSFF